MRAFSHNQLSMGRERLPLKETSRSVEIETSPLQRA
jgi:hypothetical protein